MRTSARLATACAPRASGGTRCSSPQKSGPDRKSLDQPFCAARPRAFDQGEPTRLRVSEVDLLLHWPNPRVPLSETLGALAHVRELPAIPRTSRLERLSENMEIFDFKLSEDEMRRISLLGGSNGRLTDYGFAPKWD
jgi:diketogulonate reductase-like aldo/keto reductase